MKHKKYICCDECGKELSGDDDVYFVADNAVESKFCSERCMERYLSVDLVDAQENIENTENILLVEINKGENKYVWRRSFRRKIED